MKLSTKDATQEPSKSDFLSALRLADVEFNLIDDRDICCGLPLANAGLEEALRQTAAHFTELINQRERGVLVTPCPAYLNAFRNLYPRVLEGWNCRVPVTAELLEGLMSSDRILTIQRPFSKRVIYRDPCLLSRQMGIVDEPREILARIPELSLLEFQLNRGDTL